MVNTSEFLTVDDEVVVLTVHSTVKYSKTSPCGVLVVCGQIWGWEGVGFLYGEMQKSENITSNQSMVQDEENVS